MSICFNPILHYTERGKQRESIRSERRHVWHRGASTEESNEVVQTAFSISLVYETIPRAIRQRGNGARNALSMANEEQAVEVSM